MWQVLPVRVTSTPPLVPSSKSGVKKGFHMKDKDEKWANPYEEAMRKKYREQTFWRVFLATLAVSGAVMLGVGLFIGDGGFAAGLKIFGVIALIGALLYFAAFHEDM